MIKTPFAGKKTHDLLLLTLKGPTADILAVVKRKIQHIDMMSYFDFLKISFSRSTLNLGWIGGNFNSFGPILRKLCHF